MKIDFNKKKTEEGWQKSFDAFWMKITPGWFSLLEWVLILGVISFLAKQTQNIILIIVSIMSHLFLFFYIQSMFYSIDFVNIPGIKSFKMERAISIILSGLISITIWLLISKLLSREMYKQSIMCPPNRRST